MYRKSGEIIEGLLASNPDTANVMRDAAVIYSYFGEVYGMLAAKKELPVARRLEYYQQALTLSDRSVTIWMEMRDRGILKSRDRDPADKIAKTQEGFRREMERLRK